MLKRKRVPPVWIVELPPGEYTTEQLVEITGKAPAGMTDTLKRYGARIKRVKGYKNLYKNIIIWEGYKKEEKCDT